VLLVGFNITS